ncbi:MAG: right-handed parallel beta-helix repeat-containing protein [Abditibacteriota bacterium]|nr:right-handed parallel beta-helix repeat-containing protein [Abditibacteriota bacterium]
MNKIFHILWLLPVICLLLLSAAGARTVTSVDELLELCGAVIQEDVLIEPGVYDLTDVTWTPIAEVAQGFTVSGEGAVLKSFHFANPAPGFVAENNGTISGITFRMEMFINTGSSAGVVAAANGSNGTIDGCLVYGEGEWAVGLGESRKGNYLGGIAGINDGAVTNCTVYGLTLSGGSETAIGGIAGKSTGTVFNCTVHNSSITGTAGTAVIGGIAGLLEGPDVGVNSFAEQCSVIYSSIEGDASAMGGVAGLIKNTFIGASRVNFTDIRHTGDAGCRLGGIAGTVDGGEGSNRLENSYYADKSEEGMTYIPGDVAGGIVGSYYELNNAQVFYKCYYCTDFCDAGLYGENTGQDTPHHWYSCSGETKSTMTAQGWAAENMEGGWTNAGPDNYPVITDLIPVSVSRFHRGEEYLPQSFFRLLYNGEDVANMGLVDGGMEFDPALFTLQKAVDYPDLDICADYITLNGAKLTGPVTAGDYGELCFSAVVDNLFCRDYLIPETEEGNRLYENGRGIFDTDSLIALREALDDARQAMDEAYLSIDYDWGLDLLNAIQAASMEYLFTVDIEPGDATVYVRSGSSWTEANAFVGTVGDTYGVKAETDSGHTFICWQDTAGNILSEDAEFEYTISRNTAITAVTAPKSSYTFTYRDVYGKTYKTDTVTDYSQVSYPAQPGEGGMRTGYVVREWTNDFPGTLPSQGAVQRDVTFTASFTKAAKTYTVTTYMLYQGERYLDETVTGKTAKVYTRTAPETFEDVAFTCWRNADTGETVSYDRELSVSVYSDLTLEAVYEGTAAVETCVNLWEPIVDGSKIAFTGQRVKGDDFVSEVMHGVLLLKSDAAPAELLFDTPGVIVGKSSGYSALTDTYIINKKNVSAGDTWYGRAFVIYNDIAGERKAVFSDIKGIEVP